MRAIRQKVPGLACLALGLLLAGCNNRAVLSDGSGTIECTQVQIAAQVGGRLLSLPPQEGARVKAGDRVARIDPADYLLRRSEAQALLAQAEAQAALVKAGSRPEDIRRGHEGVNEARAAAIGASNDFRRVAQLIASGNATAQQLDSVRALADRTAALLAAAEQTLARLEAGNRPEEIRLAETQVDVMRARLALTEKAVADCELFSPAEGIVTTRNHEEGEWVAPGASLLTLSRIDAVWLAVYLPETRLGKIKLGQKAWVAIDGVPRRFEGRVTFLSPEAEFTPQDIQTPDQRAKLVYRVKIALPNPEGIFKPGMPAEAYLSEPGSLSGSKRRSE
jgi:HlyD family secretion protein